MGHKFADLAFTEAVKEVQALMGSRKAYARAEAGPETHHELTEDEHDFLSARDSFYIASVSETGWPYVQHRGGPKGFVKALSGNRIGFHDFGGNRQYVTVGNLKNNQRVALILVDYPNQARLKILGTVRLIDAASDPKLMQELENKEYEAKVERAFIIQVEAYDWNCPQHITPRWTSDEIAKAVLPLQDKIKNLEQELAALREKV